MRIIIRGRGGRVCKRSTCNGGASEEEEPRSIGK
jgi:hypothetical protein